MAYPSKAEVEQVARKLNVRVIEVFGYAGVYGRNPANPQEMGAFQTAMHEAFIEHDSTPTEQQWGWSFQWYYGAAADQGHIPNSFEDVKAFLIEYGALTADGRFINTAVEPGRYYPPGNAPTTGGNGGGGGNTGGGGPTGGTSLPSTFDLSQITTWVKAHPLESAGIAVGVFLLSSKRR